MGAASAVHAAQHDRQHQHMEGVKGVARIRERLAVVTLPPAIQPTGVRETDIAQREALGYISMVETLEGQVTVTCWEDKPTVDLTVYLVEAR